MGSYDMHCCPPACCALQQGVQAGAAVEPKGTREITHRGACMGWEGEQMRACGGCSLLSQSSTSGQVCSWWQLRFEVQNARHALSSPLFLSPPTRSPNSMAASRFAPLLVTLRPVDQPATPPPGAYRVPQTISQPGVACSSMKGLMSGAFAVGDGMWHLMLV